MYLPYYNITWKNKEYEYSYFLYVLVRSFWFKWDITRERFINKGIKLWFKKSNLYNIWDRWAYKNIFFRWISENSTRLYLSSTDEFEYIIEKIPQYILEKIRGIKDFRLFLHASFLWRAWYINKDWQNTSIWVRKIANINNTTRATIHSRNTRASKFWLEVINRFCKLEDWQIVKTTNEYRSPIRVIKNKYCTMKKTSCKLIKEFVMPLFVTNNYVWDLLNKCRDNYIVSTFYEIVNWNIFNWLIERIPCSQEVRSER